VFDGYVAPSILQVEGAKDIAVEFFSLSKRSKQDFKKKKNTGKIHTITIKGSEIKEKNTSADLSNWGAVKCN
jgi:hypothetical protein